MILIVKKIKPLFEMCPFCTTYFSNLASAIGFPVSCYGIFFLFKLELTIILFSSFPNKIAINVEPKKAV